MSIQSTFQDFQDQTGLGRHHLIPRYLLTQLTPSVALPARAFFTGFRAGIAGSVLIDGDLADAIPSRGRWSSLGDASWSVAAEFAAVRELYGFRGYGEVRQFLNQHRNLLPILIDAKREIDLHFGNSTPATLEVSIDADDPTDRELFLSILTSLDPDDALDRLDALDRSWWLAVLPRAHGKLTIGLEYS